VLEEIRKEKRKEGFKWKRNSKFSVKEINIINENEK
jgi:hypothetical protein